MALEARQMRWRELWPAASGMMLEHHLERGFKREEFCIDSLNLQALELAGQLLIVGGFAQGRLVGYLFWQIGKQISCGGKLASMGPAYLKPEYRQSGLFLMMMRCSIRLFRPKEIQRLRLVSVPQGGRRWMEHVRLMDLQEAARGTGR